MARQRTERSTNYRIYRIYEEISCMYYITSLVQIAMSTILNVVINIVKPVYKVH